MSRSLLNRGLKKIAALDVPKLPVGDAAEDLWDAVQDKLPSGDAYDKLLRDLERKGTYNMGKLVGYASNETPTALAALLMAAPAAAGMVSNGNAPLVGAIRGLGAGGGMLLGFKGGRKLADILSDAEFMQTASEDTRNLASAAAIIGSMLAGGKLGHSITKELT